MAASVFQLPSFAPRLTVKPLAVLSSPPGPRVPYELKQGQRRVFHQLPSGLNLEVIEQKKEAVILEENKNGGEGSGKKNSKNPPLVFVHGSYHAAWCWAENWLPFFSSHGYDCYAISLLGQGESDAPSGSVAGSLQTHAGDVADFIQKNLEMAPVLVGHSFGGLIIQYYIANIRNDQLSGFLLRCKIDVTNFRCIEIEDPWITTADTIPIIE